MVLESRLVDLNPKWVSSGGDGVYFSNGNPKPLVEKAALEFSCPCGCGDRICIPLLPEFIRHWNMTGDSFENLSITPSIQRLIGCKTHMVITDGKILP